MKYAAQFKISNFQKTNVDYFQKKVHSVPKNICLVQKLKLLKKILDF